MDEASELSDRSVQRIRAYGELATVVWFVCLVVALLVGWYVVPISLGGSNRGGGLIGVGAALVLSAAVEWASKKLGLKDRIAAGNSAARWEHTSAFRALLVRGVFDRDTEKSARSHIRQVRRHGGKAEANELERELDLALKRKSVVQSQAGER